MRLLKRVYLWDKALSDLLQIQTWSSEVRDVFLNHNLGHIFDPETSFCPSTVIAQLKSSMAIRQNIDIKERCLEKPKLRTYVQIIDFEVKESYLSIPMSFLCRKYLALTRLSNLPIRIETGRYERPQVDAALRYCQVGCENLVVEDEYHVLFTCSMYNNLRIAWLNKLKMPENFENCLKYEKLKIVLTWPENVKVTAQFLIDICNLRSKMLHNSQF